MLIGYFDYLIIGILLTFNILLIKKKLNRAIKISIIVVGFGLILPMISMKIEIVKVSSEHEITDSFNLLFTFFKFPLYWGLGIIQGIIFLINKKSIIPKTNTLD